VDNNQPALLICIYTCDAHQRFHAEFHESRIGKYLNSFGNAQQVYVYADPKLSESKMDMGRLTVDTAEAYSNLCLKTFKMIQYCAHRITFDFLMKIDLSSGIRQLNLDPKVINRVSDEQVMIDHLEALRRSIGSGVITHYTGWKQITANRNGVERWARLKGLEIDYERLLGKVKSQEYFSGKCYTISKRFAQYIGDHGESMALAQTQYLPSEDMMIGRLHECFKT
jgi:hypothetical protein